MLYSSNYEEAVGAEFIKHLLDQGAFGIFYLSYGPIGRDPEFSLLLTTDAVASIQALLARHRVAYPMIIIDEMGSSCNAAGIGKRGMLHINANGDLEACQSLPFTDANVLEQPVVEALRSPLIRELRANFGNRDRCISRYLLKDALKVADGVGARYTYDGAREQLSNAAAELESPSYHRGCSSNGRTASGTLITLPTIGESSSKEPVR
jgi:hypothetical protein